MLNIAKKIYMVDIAEKPIAHEYLMERIMNNRKVEMINGARVIDILGNKFVTGLRYEKEGKISKLNVEGVIVEIGRVPNVEPFITLVKVDQHNHIIINAD